MSEGRVSPPRIDGLEFVPDGKGYSVTFTSPPMASFRDVLTWLPEGWELSFYDRFYPRISDPGAYIDVQRQGERFVYHMGNHGWTSEWRMQSMELLAAWMHLNLELDGPYAPPFKSVGVQPAIRSGWTGELYPVT